ncbi:probable polygalacturonase At1g80170 [Hibiscus syriacus]|uniref:probable polygalacturonase At1g80170 n=1 Tax=Hibiscus syriacus TaxID=106335 RepID=UPI0019231B1A|nr:probable polygalacturonase At1g80170 [Hibiscus syriacus]
MASLKKILAIVVLIQCATLSESSRMLEKKKKKTDGNTFNVISFGAVGDGVEDDSKGFKDAWNAACGSSASSPMVVVPQGKTFLLQPLTLDGECNSNNSTFQIDGNIIAPSEPSAWERKRNCHHWIGFKNFDGLFIQGSGTINGHGSKWWKLSCKDKNKGCHFRKPTGFMIANSKNVEIKGLTFEDSPKMHIAFENSICIHATDLTIKAPGNSPNTDGIHIQRSTNVTMDKTIIQTGLLGGHGYARNVKFERITSYASARPIVIDQFYFPHKQCKNQTSGVEISNVSYEEIHGTSHKEIAVQLSCSESTPCKNITTKNINLKNEDQNDNTLSYCHNAHGLRNGRFINATRVK